MNNVVYMGALELSKLLPGGACHTNESPNKFFSFYDTFIIQDKTTILAVLTADLLFAETLRHIKADPRIIGQVFTPPCRCNIIKFDELNDSISMDELIRRYGIPI